ncbi:hypothetical protein GQ457_03G032130 [Hibiscus cannabinus]
MASSSKPFTNKSISIRLDETNCLLWRQQVLFAIESLALSSHIDGTMSVPSQYTMVDGVKTVNAEFVVYKQQDSALYSWLLSSISTSILPSLVNCRTAFEIWEKVQKVFSVSSTTKIMHLHCSLKNLRKRDQSMREYLAQIQAVCDSLAACGNPLTETMHISAILSGLPSEYEPVIAVITSSQQSYTLDGVCSVLLDTEARQQETHLVNLVQAQSSSMGFSSGFFQSPNYSSPSYGLDRSFSGYVGQVSSPNVQNGVSQRIQDPRVQGQNNGYQFNRSFPPRGRGGRVFSGRSRPQCQLCGRVGHLVNRCYYRFDQTYDGCYNINCVEDSVEFQKADSDLSFGVSQDLSGTVAFVSNGAAQAVSDDAGWFPDSGATTHLTPDAGIILNSLPYTGIGKISVANGMTVPISRVGSGSMITNSRPLMLNNLLHVPNIKKNLLSVSKFTRDNNVSIEFFPDSCDVKDLQTRHVMLRGLETDGLYKLSPPAGSCSSQQSCAKDVSCSNTLSVSCSDFCGNTAVSREARECCNALSNAELGVRAGLSSRGGVSSHVPVKFSSVAQKPVPPGAAVREGVQESSGVVREFLSQTEDDVQEAFQSEPGTVAQGDVQNQSEAATQVSTQPVAAQTEAAQPVAAQPEAAQPVATPPVAAQPEVIPFRSGAPVPEEVSSQSIADAQRVTQSEAVQRRSSENDHEPVVYHRRAKGGSGVVCQQQQHNSVQQSQCGVVLHPEVTQQPSVVQQPQRGGVLHPEVTQQPWIGQQSPSNQSGQPSCSTSGPVASSIQESASSTSSSDSSLQKAGVSCHPMVTRSKSGVIKPKVFLAAGVSLELPEPKNILQALETKEWSQARKIEGLLFRGVKVTGVLMRIDNAGKKVGE